MRDRLIELLGCEGNVITANDFETVADYLLENGVIVPPCKVGQDIYRISGTEVYGAWQIVKLAVYEDEMGFEDDSDNWIAFEDIGKTVFLTREEAEQKLVNYESTKDDVERKEDENVRN